MSDLTPAMRDDKTLTPAEVDMYLNLLRDGLLSTEFAVTRSNELRTTYATLRARVDRLESALREIIYYTQPMGYDWGDANVLRIAKEALDG